MPTLASSYCLLRKKEKLTMAPSRPTTQAKNTTQHPGLVVLEAQQKQRCAAEMTKVRFQERLNRRLTERHLHVALKNVARVQDQQRDEDIEADIPKVAPSLRHHKTQAYLQDVPSMVVDDDDDNDNNGFVVVETEKASLRDESIDETDPLSGDGATKINDWFDNKSEENNLEIMIEEEGEVKRPKKKKKGEGVHVLVESLRKNLPTAENSKLNLNLVMAPPPIPVPKSKKARPMCVEFYLIA